MEASDAGDVNLIGYSCIEKNPVDAIIDGIGCNSSPEQFASVKSSSKEYCSYSSFATTRVYFKNNAFFVITNEPNKIEAVGLVSSPSALNYADTYYEPCVQVLSKVSESKSAGFESVYDMDLAAKDGIKTGQEWMKEKAKRKFKTKFDKSTNSLERALVVLISTPKEFQSHKDDGGLNVLSSWLGYEMQSVEVEYTSRVLTLFHAVVASDYKNPNKPATVNNLKRDLIDECGTEWKPNYRGDAYTSDSNFSRCEISQARAGGYHIVVSVKSKPSD